MTENTDLPQAIAETEAHVLALKRQMKQASCLQVGHGWQFYGGCNAGCWRDCGCSVSVNVCSKCGDCDYGDNQEAADIRARCAEEER